VSHLSLEISLISIISCRRLDSSLMNANWVIQDMHMMHSRGRRDEVDVAFPQYACTMSYSV